MRIEVIRGNIIEVEADCIVNAANATLLGGGGVDGVIHRAAGPGLLAECATLGGAKTGEVKATGGHDLPYDWIFHAVGPIWRGGDRDEEEALRSCYLNALGLAAEKGCRTIAFPAISTGAFSFPSKRAAEIAVEACREWDDDLPEHCLLVAIDGENHGELRRAFSREA